MKKIFGILFLALASWAEDAWQIKGQWESLGDGADYAVQSPSLVLEHNSDYAGQKFVVQGMRLALNTSDGAILPFAENALRMQGEAHDLWGNWWGSIQGGMVLLENAPIFEGKLTLAQVWAPDNAKHIPRLQIFQQALSNHPLPLHISTVTRGVALGWAWENALHMGDAQLTWENWQSGVDSLPTPQQVHFSAYQWGTQGTWRWGFSGALDYADRTTQVLTQVSPEPLYQWLPAASPRMNLATALLLSVNFLPWQNWKWGAEISVPVLSGQVRQWEDQRVSDWGTAPLVFKSHMKYDWDKAFAQLELASSTTPWSHMQYFGADAYWDLQTKLEIGVQW